MLCFAVDVGAGNDDDVRGCHNPKGVIAGYWDFDAEPHNATKVSTMDSISITFKRVLDR
jgi:hypothetical protein